MSKPETVVSAVIVFDGICLLCSRWVRFVLKHDRAGRYHFASMQSKTGRALLLAHGLDPHDPSSLLLVEQGRGVIHTNAVAAILSGLGSRRCALLARLMRAKPRAWRDPLYRWIARHRYRIFGRSQQCYLPNPAEAARFLP